MKHFLLALALFCSFSASAFAETYSYEGTWKTVNRKLDGTMTCDATYLGNEKWKGRFYGVWMRVPFDYTVEFDGKTDVKGHALIDGAKYNWTGKISETEFTADFDGDRYKGGFELKAKKVKKEE